ncbi:hypothetical protein SynBIOSE41_02780 [Synechococcus sp. BIOS-E4-1]|nr:hypothetical protein SynBIOSE41_02780 [Synechococcus sp. BIOS-E4-1]
MARVLIPRCRVSTPLTTFRLADQISLLHVWRKLEDRPNCLDADSIIFQSKGSNF